MVDVSQIKILITEDDRDLQRILKLSLEAEGFQILQAYDGKECLQMVRERRPHLILLDLMMPEMDGFEVCRRLKSMDSSRDIPIIVLTAKSGLAAKERCFSFHADDYVVKPYDFDELLARIYMQLGRAIEVKDSRERAREEAARLALEEVSEQLRKTFAESLELVDKLKSGAGERLKATAGKLEGCLRRVISVVEGARIKADPFYESPFLEESEVSES